MNKEKATYLSLLGFTHCTTSDKEYYPSIWGPERFLVLDDNNEIYDVRPETRKMDNRGFCSLNNLTDSELDIFINFLEREKQNGKHRGL